MIRALRSLSLATLLAGVIFSCGDPSEDESESIPTGPSTESHETVLNQFTISRGDAQAALENARVRLQRLTSPAVVPQAVTTLPTKGTLVLYDTTGPWGWLGELYATNVNALVSHFGAATAKPVANYTAGELASYSGLVYVGSTFDEPLPTALLDDVLGSTAPVVWIDDNIWQLAARTPTFATDYGFMPWIFDYGAVATVNYKGVALTRYESNGAGIMTYSAMTTGTVLAQATRKADNVTIPWAVRGKNITYIGENPMSYVTSNDRYLAFCDLLIDAFAPATVERHRALVRIEDVNPTTSANRITQISDYLYAQKVPFSIALIPKYRDPLGAEHNGVPTEINLSQKPALLTALRYATTRGGTIVMHGYTHQYGAVKNPYDGVTAGDFEFYKSHIDSLNYVIYDGPVAEDSQAWADGRLKAGLDEIAKSVIAKPTIFEFPHYAGSDADARAVRGRFSTVYHRGLYFGGQLTGQTPNYTRPIGVVYPYTGTDLYGFKVLPETMGSYEPEPSNNNPARLVTDLLATAQANKVVRDGFASFYFHPYYNISILQQIVTGVKAAGYTFVAPTSL